MTTLDLCLLGQLLLNIVMVVQHIRLKRSCECHINRLEDWCVSLDQRLQDLL